MIGVCLGFGYWGLVLLLPPVFALAEIGHDLSRWYPLVGFLGGYIIVLLFNPVRLALRDGFRCILRYKRIWATFVLLGFAYFVFQFSTFTPIESLAEVDLTQIFSLANWHWPTFLEIWQEAPLPALEGVAGIFDNATTTYPLSAIAAVLMLLNWRGLHGALVRALHKRFRVLRLSPLSDFAFERDRRLAEADRLLGAADLGRTFADGGVIANVRQHRRGGIYL